MGKQQRHPWRAAILAAGALAVALAPRAATAEEAAVGQPFAPVVERVVQGDLLLAGNSNLLSAGGWRDESLTAADVDGDATRMCINRTVGASQTPRRRRVCADNSSSAELTVPTGSRVIAARLYLETSVSRNVGSLRARLDGPSDGFSYQTLADASVTRSPLKLYEAVADDGEGAVLRQAVWDVTDYVAAAGPGTYTVADIVNERVGPWLPYTSWAIVAAYELDPAREPDAAATVDPSRFASRFISWHDGFQHVAAGALDVPIRGVDGAAATFGKSFHLVAGGRGGSSDNLLFENAPLGNNNAPDDAPPPTGVQLGTDPACNTVTDVQNDSICVLGTNVGTKSPGATAFRSSADGATTSSGSGVDMDVIRIPDRYLRAAGAEAVVEVRASGRDSLAPGMIAVSMDVQRSGA